MKIEKEIEFKTEITKEQYESLIDKFNLEKSIYKLDNYYFDSLDKILMNNFETLRIRVKDEKSYTLTLKRKDEIGSTENHYTLKEKDALTMISSGFNLKDLFDKNINVLPHGNLTTYRARMPYKVGELFFDKINYYGIVKYEIEYESKYYSLGYKIFLDFLKENKIKYTPTMKKSRRVFEYLKSVEK